MEKEERTGWITSSLLPQEIIVSEVSESVVLPVSVFNSVTEYLSNRPYREVNRLIEEIRSTTKLVDLPEETEETTDE